MSPSSTEALAIGLGSRLLALGRQRSASARFADRLHAALPSWAMPGSHPSADVPPEGAGDSPATTPAPDASNAPRLTIEIDEALRYTERGAIEALRNALRSNALRSEALKTEALKSEALAVEAPQAAPSTERVARVTRRAAIVLDDFWGNHAIVRGDFRSMHARDVEDVVRAYFSDVFGANSSADSQVPSIRWQVREDGRALFASALSRTLLDGIGQACSDARVQAESITLGLPQILNRVRRAVSGHEGLLLVVGDTTLHAVTIEDGRWLAYDAQRVFPNATTTAAPLGEVARHVFERASVRLPHDCKVYVCGLAVDPGQFDPYFDHVQLLTDHISGHAPACCLMEFAQ